MKYLFFFINLANNYFIQNKSHTKKEPHFSGSKIEKRKMRLLE